jgi:transcriptional regulator with XRE-family HTH domain
MKDEKIPVEELNAAALTAWRERMGYTADDAVQALGATARQLAAWESGAKPIPYYVGLAMAALALGIEPYKR